MSDPLAKEIREVMDAATAAAERRGYERGVREAANIADGYGSVACDVDMRDAILMLIKEDKTDG